MTYAAAVSQGWKFLPRLPNNDRVLSRHDTLGGQPMSPATPAPLGPLPRYELRGVSRYELLVKIGSGGTASVYIGRVSGSAGFSRLVAVKRAHPHLTHDAVAQKMLVTEARLASRLNHANVVSVQDVEHTEEELLLVMDYVEG